jgi:hypothetical protein
MIPQSLQPLFWDVDVERLDPGAWPEYTIFRILEYGDEDAVAWMRRLFSEAQIIQIIRNERRLSPRSANFWALVYGISERDVAALEEGGANRVAQ